MPSAWRVDKKKWQAVSFDGSGAAKEGGRWNSAGVRVVYLSQHLAMASLEKYVHLPKPVPTTMEFVSFQVEFAGVPVKRLQLDDLPASWQAAPPTAETQKVGDDWVASNATAILAFPSALIPAEENYLLNPAHPDFPKIVISPPEDFVFTHRVARLIEPPKP